MNGDCGMYSRGAPRADLGAGFANGDGGIVTRGDSETGFDVLALELACDVALWLLERVLFEAFES